MKRYLYSIPFLLSGLCLCVSQSASAATTESVELKVTGVLSMGACYPVLDNGGVVDYGKISNHALESAAPNDLGKKSINLTVTCDNAHVAGFTITDNAAASAMTGGVGAIAGTNAFGLGQTAGGVNLGSYSITMASVTLDGTDGDVLSSSDSGASWGAAADGGLADNAGTTVWSAGAAGVDDTAAAATAFVYGIDVNAVLQDSATLAITDDTQLAGSATFTLVYP
ncbi:DUF1120 domain-containing protein [Enterobacter hormaechei]|uniref:DUF1120 domain-containing protein n=1 Tax=Enterobacter hormaechei TaxID=158836 RepID=UPI002A755EFA|nr:DUF1120 domain-containing protein [Enterobacter hormaechei]MDY3572527.1 DUF1120 domain-containing protein [Enterobacter hormaechei]